MPPVANLLGFARSPRRLSRMSAVGGGLMIGLGATLVATGSKA